MQSLIRRKARKRWEVLTGRLMLFWQKFRSLEQLNKLFRVWSDEYNQLKPHIKAAFSRRKRKHETPLTESSRIPINGKQWKVIYLHALYQIHTKLISADAQFSTLCEDMVWLNRHHPSPLFNLGQKKTLWHLYSCCKTFLHTSGSPGMLSYFLNASRFLLE